ncbi:hypothetical protein FHG87_019499, partial [Trinorchestia longiramus]
IRVDVVLGDFLRPTRGVCINQVLAVEGDVIDDPWVQVPPLCGAMTGSHFYLHLRDQRSSPPLTVGAKMSPRHRTVTLNVSTRAATEPYRFVMWVSQLPCYPHRQSRGRSKRKTMKRNHESDKEERRSFVGATVGRKIRSQGKGKGGRQKRQRRHAHEGKGQKLPMESMEDKKSHEKRNTVNVQSERLSRATASTQLEEHFPTLLQQQPRQPDLNMLHGIVEGDRNEEILSHSHEGRKIEAESEKYRLNTKSTPFLKAKDKMKIQDSVHKINLMQYQEASPDLRQLMDGEKIPFQESSERFQPLNDGLQGQESGRASLLRRDQVLERQLSFLRGESFLVGQKLSVLVVLLAPAGCLQYFIEQEGVIESFNYYNGQYLNNLLYNICLKAPTTASILQFSVSRNHSVSTKSLRRNFTSTPINVRSTPEESVSPRVFIDVLPSTHHSLSVSSAISTTPLTATALSSAGSTLSPRKSKASSRISSTAILGTVSSPAVSSSPTAPTTLLTSSHSSDFNDPANTPTSSHVREDASALGTWPNQVLPGLQSTSVSEFGLQKLNSKRVPPDR